MARDVVKALKETESLDGIAVITHDARVIKWAEDQNLKIINDEATKGLSQAVAFASQELGKLGAKAILSVLADIPLVKSSDFSVLLQTYAAISDPALVLARSRDGDGSNAMVFAPDTMDFHYGPGSAKAHLKEAQSRGLVTKSLDLERVGHDIDTPQDLKDLLTTLSLLSAESATAHVLTKLGIAGRLQEP